MNLVSIRKRASNLNLSHAVWAKLTSARGEQKIWQPEISAWLSDAAPLKKEKQDRLVAVLEELENLVETSPVRIDMRTVESIEEALAVMPALVDINRERIIKNNSTVPFAVATPSWPARAYAKATPSAAKLLAEEQK
jgi:uncharacterized protein YqcC (DUF446 family)